jgi:hypothetical protein
MSQLLHGQTAFDRPDVTTTVFKSRLDLMKINLRNGKYFDGCKLSYHFHVIEYQYRGLPHAHLVARFKGSYDIDDENRANLLEFVNKHFIAEIPRFEGEDCQNIFSLNGTSIITDSFKRKAVEVVRMNNTHKCAVAINGCKRQAEDECKRGYGRADIIPDTFVGPRGARVVYVEWPLRSLLSVRLCKVFVIENILVPMLFLQVRESSRCSHRTLAIWST